MTDRRAPVESGIPGNSSNIATSQNSSKEWKTVRTKSKHCNSNRATTAPIQSRLDSRPITILLWGAGRSQASRGDRKVLLLLPCLPVQRHNSGRPLTTIYCTVVPPPPLALPAYAHCIKRRRLLSSRTESSNSIPHSTVSVTHLTPNRCRRRQQHVCMYFM